MTEPATATLGDRRVECCASVPGTTFEGFPDPRGHGSHRPATRLYRAIGGVAIAVGLVVGAAAPAGAIIIEWRIALEPGIGVSSSSVATTGNGTLGGPDTRSGPQPHLDLSVETGAVSRE